MECPDDASVRNQLVRIFSSEQFRNSPRLQAFLRFIVTSKLSGNTDQIKESTIALTVFRRESSFNNSSDSIVRSAARRLRSRLEEYYAQSGVNDSLRIEIPKGNYVPEIYERKPANSPESIAPMQVRPGTSSYRRRGYAGIGALAVCGALVATLVLASRRPTRVYVPRGDAYEYYTRGEYALTHHEKAVPLFEAAVKADPKFAAAYLGIAHAYTQQAANDEIAPESSLARAADAAQIAMKLEPSSAGAHAVMGYVYYCQWKWAEADRQFRISTDLQPNLADAWRWWALVHFADGRFDLAEQSLRRAASLETGTLRSVGSLSQIYYYERKYDKAIQSAQRILAVEHNNYLAHWVIASSLLEQGHRAEALEQWRPMLDLPEYHKEARRQLAFYEALSGNTADLRVFVNDCETQHTNYCSPWIMGQAYGLLGDRQDCFRSLRESAARHDPDLISVRFEPMVDGIRGSPEYQEIVHQLGF